MPVESWSTIAANTSRFGKRRPMGSGSVERIPGTPTFQRVAVRLRRELRRESNLWYFRSRTADHRPRRLSIGGRRSCEAGPGLVEIAPPVQRALGIGTENVTERSTHEQGY